jgi:hypothetical protein
MLTSVKGTRTNQLKQGLESMEDAAVAVHCTLLRNPSPQPTGVLEHCREVETNC